MQYTHSDDDEGRRLEQVRTHRFGAGGANTIDLARELNAVYESFVQADQMSNNAGLAPEPRRKWRNEREECARLVQEMITRLQTK